MTTDKIVPVLDDQPSVIAGIRSVVPTLSAEFVAMMTEKTSNALYRRLEQAGDLDSIQLLDHFVALMNFAEQVKDGEVQEYLNNDIVAVVGELTYLVKWEDVG